MKRVRPKNKKTANVPAKQRGAAKAPRTVKVGKIAQFKAVFFEAGEEAALAKARELRIRPSRTVRLVAKWGTQLPSKRERVRPSKRADMPPCTPEQWAAVQVGQFVQVTWLPGGDPAKLIAKGSEQSEIKWPNGNVRIFSNKELVPAVKRKNVWDV